MANPIKIDARRILGHTSAGMVMAAPVKPGVVKPRGIPKPSGIVKPKAPVGRE